MLFVRRRDGRRELTHHLLKVRALLAGGELRVSFKPSLTQPPGQPPRWLALLSSRGSGRRLGRLSFNFHRSDEAPTADDLLYVLDDIIEACCAKGLGRVWLERSRLHVDTRQGAPGDRVCADLTL